MSAWYMSVALSKSSVFICNESDYSSLIGRIICCVLPFELVISLRSNFILFYNCFVHFREFYDTAFYV